MDASIVRDPQKNRHFPYVSIINIYYVYIIYITLVKVYIYILYHTSLLENKILFLTYIFGVHT